MSYTFKTLVSIFTFFGRKKNDVLKEKNYNELELKQRSIRKKKEEGSLF